MGEVVDIFLRQKVATAATSQPSQYEDLVDRMVVSDIRAVDSVSSTEADIDSAKFLAQFFAAYVERS